MKQSLLLLAITLLSNILNSQNTEPYRRDNLIQIITNQTAEQNFYAFGNHLVKRGYTFERTDKDFMTIVTNEKFGLIRTLGYKFHIAFIDSIIHIRTLAHSYNGFVSQQQWYQWSYRISKGDERHKQFRSFINDLKSFSINIRFYREDWNDRWDEKKLVIISDKQKEIEEQEKNNQITKRGLLLLGTEDEYIFLHPNYKQTDQIEMLAFDSVPFTMNSLTIDGDYSLPSSYFLKYLSQNQNLKAMFPQGWYWSNEDESDESVLCVNIGTGEMKKISKAERAYFLPILLEEK